MLSDRQYSCTTEDYQKVLAVVCSPYTDLDSRGNLLLAQQQGSAGEQRGFKQRTVDALSGMEWEHWGKEKQLI